MIDLRGTIAPKSDQMNADDMIGGPVTITVSKVAVLDSPDQPVAIYFNGDNGKPYKPGKSMRRMLIGCWGKDGEAYVGRSMTLYRDDSVRFGGQEIGGIRISHLSHISKPITMALTATRGQRKPYTVQPLQVVDDAKLTAAVDALMARIVGAKDAAEIAAITDDPAVAKQRAWLSTNRPELAQEVTRAIEAAQSPKAGA